MCSNGTYIFHWNNAIRNVAVNIYFPIRRMYYYFPVGRMLNNIDLLNLLSNLFILFYVSIMYIFQNCIKSLQCHVIFFSLMFNGQA